MSRELFQEGKISLNFKPEPDSLEELYGMNCLVVPNPSKNIKKKQLKDMLPPFIEKKPGQEYCNDYNCNDYNIPYSQ